MDRPYLAELLRRLRMSDPSASATVDRDGRATVLWRPEGRTEPVALTFTEQDLAMTVRAGGEDCRDDLWPGSSIDQAGFSILLVHLDEVVATRVVTEPLRITAQGLVWPT